MSSSTEILGRFVWHELLTTDTAAAAAYYPKVLPWRAEASNMPGYTIFMAGTAQVAGLMELPQEGSAAHWLVYVGTPDVDGTCAKAQSLGARVVKAAADIPNVGRFGVLSDPQGATFAVFTPKVGQAPPSAPAQGGFSWHELATTDVAGALRFYGDLFGWRKGPGHDMGPMGVYQIFEHGGTQVGGMCPPGAAHTAPSWLSYVNVADASRAAAAAKSAGGRLLHGPMEVPGGSWVALLVDPQGSSFAVHELPRAAATKPAAAEKPARAPKPLATPAAAAKPAKAATAAGTPAAATKPATSAPKSAGRPGRAAGKTAKKRATARRKTAASRSVRKAGRKSARKAPGLVRRRAVRTTRSARRGARRKGGGRRRR
ncbi:MAG: VOC family protein [Gammaproteobacteria bacterium]|nr:VOC family protein [Gammaproteobacteria bacterium]